jgi:hypothetical protein
VVTHQDCKIPSSYGSLPSCHHFAPQIGYKPADAHGSRHSRSKQLHVSHLQEKVLRELKADGKATQDLERNLMAVPHEPLHGSNNVQNVAKVPSPP